MCHSAACNSTNSTYSSTSGKLFPQHVWFSDLIKIHAISQFPITLGPLEVRLFPFSYSLVVPILISSLGGFTSSRSWFFVYLCPWIYFPSVISNPYYVFRAHVFISASGTLFCPASTLRILFRFITSFVLSKNNFSCLSPVSRTLFSHSPRFPLGYWSISTKSRFRVSFNSIATFHIGNLRANWMLMAEVNYNSSWLQFYIAPARKHSVCWNNLENSQNFRAQWEEHVIRMLVSIRHLPLILQEVNFQFQLISTPIWFTIRSASTFDLKLWILILFPPINLGVRWIFDTHKSWNVG